MCEMASLDMSGMSSADFRAYLNQVFTIHVPDHAPIPLELIEVREADQRRVMPNTKRHPFTLLFRGPKEFYLPQYDYRMETAKGESVSIFIVPIGLNTEGSGMLYEAVFN